jgi:hypothetical protein
MFRVVPTPIISSAYNCIYDIWYLSHRYCYLPLSWKSWNWFECALGGDYIYVCVFVCGGMMGDIALLAFQFALDEEEWSALRAVWDFPEERTPVVIELETFGPHIRYEYFEEPKISGCIVQNNSPHLLYGL